MNMLLALIFAISPSTATIDRTPPCKYEDGSGQARCVWDARHMGNGAGRSFIATSANGDDATITYITHRRAHRLYSTNR